MSILIIWDWDNTLMDTSEALREALKDTMEHYHLPAPTQEDVNEVLGHHKGIYWENKFHEKLEEAFDFTMKRFSLYHQKSELFPQAKMILKNLHQQGIPQLIVSNKPKDLLDIEVQKTGVRDYVSGVVGTDYILPDKKPMPHFGALEIAQIPHDIRIVIGDGAADMEYAAAIKALAVYLKPLELADKNVIWDYRFDTLNDVYKWIEKFLINK